MSLPGPQVNFQRVRFTAGAAALTGIPAGPGIYRIVCLPLRLAYVGQSYSLIKRCLEHQQALRDGTHTNHRLLAAYEKYGPQGFYFEVLELYRGRWSKDCLSPAEQRWMDLHGKPSLFNVRPAGSDDWLAAIDISARSTRPQGRAVGTSSDKDWRNKLKPPKKKGTP